jgi:hypothetical protein
MTSMDREFHQHARLVSHYLELLQQLQELRFDDPRPTIQATFDLINRTVRSHTFYPPFLYNQFLTYTFRQLL